MERAKLVIANKHYTTELAINLRDASRYPPPLLSLIAMRGSLDSSFRLLLPLPPSAAFLLLVEPTRLAEMSTAESFAEMLRKTWMA